MKRVAIFLKTKILVVYMPLKLRELHLKIIIQWIHLYNSCDDDLLSVTGLEGKQLTDGLRQNQK